MLMNFLQALESSRVASTIAESGWLFPLIESTHVLALALVIGSIAIVDLRLMNLALRRRIAGLNMLVFNLRIAPQMRLRLAPDGPDLTRRMANREVHFALLPSSAIEDMAPAPLRFRPLFKDGTTAIADRNHPIAAYDRLTQEDLLSYRHVFFVPHATASTSRRMLALSGGADIDVAVRTTHMMLVPELVRGTPHIALLPGRFAASLQSNSDFVIRPVDVEAPDFTMGIALSTVFDTDQAHLWFRNLLLNQDEAASNAHLPYNPDYPYYRRTIADQLNLATPTASGTERAKPAPRATRPSITAPPERVRAG